MAKGKITTTTTTTMWHTVGAKAVSGWQVMQAEATIKAKEAKVRAAKKHQDATTNAAVLDEAFAAAARRGSEEDCTMKGPDLKAAVDAVYLFTQQPGTRSTHGDKPKRLAFLASLATLWTDLLLGARGTSDAVIASAVDAQDTADRQLALAFVTHAPPLPPAVVPAAARAAGPIEFDELTPAEEAAMLSRLVARKAARDREAALAAGAAP